MKKLLLLLIFTSLAIVNSAYSQAVCGGTFTDPAGPNSNYANNSNFTTTICPTNSGEVVTVTFTSFGLENNYDFLKVYNGTSATAPLIANLSGFSIPQAITSTDPTGCLTFVFTSDTSVNNTGWISNVSCGPPVSSNCLPPTSLMVTNITATSAVIGWTAQSNETSWVLNVQLNGTPVTTMVAQQNPFVLTGLTCNSVYNFSISANCFNETSQQSSQLSFLTSACTPQPGQPVDLTQCEMNGQTCFDFTTNSTYIYGDLNQADYTLTYHLTEADANAGVNVLISPYCTNVNSQLIFARLENNTTQEFQIFIFSINVVTVAEDVIILSNMQQCDDNNDTSVIFNLTNAQAQINSTNGLEYFTSLANAQNQVAQIANPSAFTVGTQSQITAIFIREIVPNGCDNIYTFQVIAYANCNIAYTCSQANSLCNSLGVPFANTISSPSSGNAACLGSTPNPTWFYLPISSAGNINLMIQQSTTINFASNNLDVDYIVYGPFTNPVTPCSSGTLLGSVVACSYSAAPVEYPIIPNAQPGQFYLLMVTNFSNQNGFIKITELSTTQGQIDCSGLRLNAFLDTNNNGTKEVGEPNFPLGQFTYEVNDNGTIHNIISPTGVYNIYDNNATNSYDLSYVIDPVYATAYGITTAAYNNINVVVGAGMQPYNFPITVTQAYNDLAVAIVPINAPRPGFTYQNMIVYTNFGNQTVASGTVSFNKDSLITITGNTQSGTTTTASGFTYNFTNLLPFEVRTTTVTMQVPNIPVVSIGNYLTNTASIIPLTGDVVSANNTATSSQQIIGSYDPNDKMESRGEQVLFSSFSSNDFLYYTVRFENTGTASAINVRVNDILDAALDQTSIRMVAASHPYIMDRLDNNLTWKFDNIQLPPSVANTNIGKGYVMFRVKPLPGYAVGDIIPNTASIYFDFNPAIITNTFNTVFVAQLAVSEFENNDFIFYPNPVSDVVTVSLKNEVDSIESIAVYDILGKLIFAKKPSNAITSETIDLSSVSKGMYLLEVTTTANLKVVKKLIVQ
jgi:hypothetical protein